MIAARPPHKDPHPILDFEVRRDMLALALEDIPYFQASDLEYRLPGRSYSIDTFKHLSRTYENTVHFFFILGLDSFLDITTWKDYRELFKYTAFVVLNRPGYDSDGLADFIRDNISSDYRLNGKEDAYTHPVLQSIYYCDTTLMDISSTRIRSLVARNRSIRFLLPESVNSLIRRKGLYKE